MKYILYIVLLLNVLLLSQTNKKEKLDWVRSRGDIIVTEEGNNIYRFEYPGGKVDYKYLGDNEYKDTSHIPTTVIDTWNVDTTLYEDLYSFWQEVLVSTNSNEQLIIGDANKNGYPEIYGYSKDYGEPFALGLPTEIFEMDSSEIFENKYQFPDSIRHVNGLYNILGNGELNLLTRSFPSYLSQFYIMDEQTSLLTSLDFIFYLYIGQLNDPKFGDFDKNGITDFLFYNLSPRKTVVCEYNYSSNNFDLVTEIAYPYGYAAGYAIGDFDDDGKTDIVYGSLEGEVFIIEVEKEHTYNLVWQKDIVGYTSYMQMFTNDIDKNGKPEFWVSCTTDNGVTDITRFTCFEYTGDNEYKEIHRIDFMGIFSFYGYNAFPVDVDKDGTEELVILFDQHLFILKFDGSPNRHSYKIFYMRRENMPGVFYGATMYDLNNDGYEELLIHQDILDSTGNGKHFTQIFKPSFITTVEDNNELVISDYSLEQNYPNPFNPSTKISYALREDSKVLIKVYDLLGTEVAELINETKPAGFYETTFDASDLSSGVYIYRITALSGDRILFSQSKQMLLIK